MIENETLGAYGIMYVVTNKKNQVLNLLLKNGVLVPSNSSDIQIALLVTNLLKVSPSFYEEFSILLLDEEIIDSLLVNMSGSYFNIIGDSDWCKDTKNKTDSPSAYKTLCESSSPKPKSKLEEYINQGLGLLQTGFQGYLQLNDNKTKIALADASIKVSENTVKEKELTPPTATKTGLSTGAIVGLSFLGVTVIGLIFYFINKNKS